LFQSWVVFETKCSNTTGIARAVLLYFADIF